MGGILDITATQGMNVTEKYGSNLRPYDWLDSIFDIYPNGGKAFLTGMLSLAKKFTPVDPEYKWNARDLEPYHAAVLAVYGGTLGSPTDLGDTIPVAGDSVVVALSETDGMRFVAGDMFCLSKDTDIRYAVLGRVVGIGEGTVDGADAILFQVKLVQNSSSLYRVASCNTLMLAGSSFQEGSSFGTATTRDPIEFYNYAQIVKRDLEMSADAVKMQYRGGSAWDRYKKDKLREVSVDVETMILLGERSKEYDAATKKIVRTSRGIFHTLKDPVLGAPENIRDFRTLYANGTTFALKGKEFLDDVIRRAFMYTEDGVKLALCSPSVLQEISNLALTYSDINIVPDTKKFGLNIRTWECPNGVLEFKSHPLFSMIPALQDTMVIVDTNYIELAVYRPVEYKESTPRADTTFTDAYRGEYLGAVGTRILNPRAFVWASGIGKAATGVV